MNGRRSSKRVATYKHAEVFRRTFSGVSLPYYIVISRADMHYIAPDVGIVELMRTTTKAKALRYAAAYSNLQV